MIVQCPGCASRYRVRAEKLPAAGGNIQCPNCRSIFPASHAPGGADGPLRTLPGSGIRAKTHSIPPPVPPTGAMGTDTASPAVAVGSKSPPSKDLTWKIRTPVGLVYDFPNIEALTSWLATRENVDGMVVSTDDGNTWHDIRNYPELESALPVATGKARPDMGSTSADTAVAEAMDAVLASRGATIPVPKPPIAQKTEKTTPPKPTPRRPEASTILEKPRRSSPAGSGLEPGKPGPRPTTRPTRPSSRPGPRPSLRRGKPAAAPKSAGTGTYIGLVVCLLVILAGVLQVTGAVDVAGALGLRNAPTPAAPVQTSDDAVATEQSQESTEADDEFVVVEPEYVSALLDDSDYLVDDTQFGSDAPSQVSTELVSRGIDPHDARITTLVNRAVLTAERGEVGEAIQLISGAAQISPNNSDLVCLLSDLHRRNGSLVEAEALSQQCSTLRAAQDTRSQQDVSEDDLFMHEPSALQTQ